MIYKTDLLLERSDGVSTLLRERRELTLLRHVRSYAYIYIYIYIYIQ